jgi:hypothetical protein
MMLLISVNTEKSMAQEEEEHNRRHINSLI